MTTPQPQPVTVQWSPRYPPQAGEMLDERVVDGKRECQVRTADGRVLWYSERFVKVKDD